MRLSESEGKVKADEEGVAAEEGALKLVSSSDGPPKNTVGALLGSDYRSALIEFNRSTNTSSVNHSPSAGLCFPSIMGVRTRGLILSQKM